MLVDLYPEMGASVTASVSCHVDHCVLEGPDEAEIRWVITVQPREVFDSCWSGRSHVSTLSNLPSILISFSFEIRRSTIAIL